MRSYLMSMRGRCEVSYQWVSIHRSSVRVAYAAGTILVDRCEHATSYLTLDEVACYFRIPRVRWDSVGVIKRLRVL